MTADIFLVTPCLDAVGTIDQTISSVVTQAGPFRLHYHVQDGGSLDGTWERLLWWQDALARGDFPLACADLRFSCHRGRDSGMYDALVSGFSVVAPADDAFLSWINADDLMQPGALALVASVQHQFSRSEIAWLGGAVSVMQDGVIVAAHDRPLPTALIRAGLCDHEHWPYVQQEGVFFRAGLWRSVEPDRTIRPMRLAGDWNLWRLFARNAEFVQLDRPLATFRIRPGQLSSTAAESYTAEIDAIVPRAERTRAFLSLAAQGGLTRLRIERRFGQKRFSLVEEAVDGRLHSRRPDDFGAQAFEPGRKTIAKGRLLEVDPSRDEAGPPRHPAVVSARLRHVRRQGGCHALDEGWQFPAITEEHAYRQILACGGGPVHGVVYVGYPWASLIDQLQAKGTEAEAQMAAFSAFCDGLPETRPRVTVCQHVLLKQHLHLFERAGIDHIFWPHTSKDDMSRPASGPTLHPFPLFPVQTVPPGAQPAAEDRPYLFGFVGARANPHYLSDIRSAILDRLSDRPDALILGRDDWHYSKVVYGHQIWRTVGRDDPALIDEAASRTFREALARCIFTLCPSGSGPNSIRLWEALGSGSIPVILSDTLALPGDPALWSEAAVVCAENPVALDALPGRLRSLAERPETLERMRAAGRQIWHLYGPGGFVPDILALLQDLASRPVSPTGFAGSPALLSLARQVSEAPRPDMPSAALLLTLAAGLPLRPGADLLPGCAMPSFLVSAIGRARAALGPAHPAVRHFVRMSRAGSHAADPRGSIAEDALLPYQDLFPPGTGPRPPSPAGSGSTAGARRPEITRQLDAARQDAFETSMLPAPALVSDREAVLLRIGASRPLDDGIAGCLDRWSACADVEAALPVGSGAWPDARLARHAALFGRVRVLWTLDGAEAADICLDALVIGAVPGCPDVAGLERLVPASCRLDLTGLTSAQARGALAAFRPDPAFAGDWLAARAGLARRLASPDRLLAERRKVADHMRRALDAVTEDRT